MTQFVYFYVPGPKQGLELKLSIDLLTKHFVGKHRVTVIGDKPPWYDGHYIPIKRNMGIQDAKTRMPFRDTQKKIMTCASHPEIDEEFWWIMDDVFLINPVTVAELRVPRYDPWYQITTKSTWHQLIRITFAALAKHDKPTLQFGTHLPHVFEKSKLRELFPIYNFPKELLLFEILYANHFHHPKKAVPYGSTWEGVEYPRFIHRILSPKTERELNLIQSKFVNYAQHLFNPTMQRWLAKQVVK